MHSDHSVTGWIEDLRGHSDAEAAQAIWEKFQRRLLAVAFRHLGGAVRGAGDADDVVNEAFASFYGPDFYGLPRNTGQLRLRRETLQVPAELAMGEHQLTPLLGGDSLAWTAERL